MNGHRLLAVAALDAILAEWGRTDAGYTTRISHLTSGGVGTLNGPYLLTASTVHDDAAIDVLYGKAGMDWSCAKRSGANKGRVKDQAIGEVITGL